MLLFCNFPNISNNSFILKQYTPALTSNIPFCTSSKSVSSITSYILFSFLITLPYPFGSLIMPVSIVATSSSFIDLSTIFCIVCSVINGIFPFNIKTLPDFSSKYGIACIIAWPVPKHCSWYMYFTSSFNIDSISSLFSPTITPTSSIPAFFTELTTLFITSFPYIVCANFDFLDFILSSVPAAIINAVILFIS